MTADFGALPPEVSSGRMYLGPGAAPMMAAATAWGAIADELWFAATRFDAVIAELAGFAWFGPSALAMQRAAAHYAAWLHITAAVAEGTSGQAWVAVAAYEAAFTMTVPPPAIMANRTLLGALIATNLLGQNTPAIAATEAQYAEMWVQDATAMYGYAASAAAARQLTPFTEPQQVAAPTVTAANPLSISTLLTAGLSATKVVNTVMSTTSSAVSGRGILITGERLIFGGTSAEEEGTLVGLPIPASSAPGARAITSPGSAGMGRATLVGRLSVPAQWATAAPGIRPTPLPPTQCGDTVPALQAEAPPGSAGIVSQSVLGTLSRDGPEKPRHRTTPIIVRSPAAG